MNDRASISLSIMVGEACKFTGRGFIKMYFIRNDFGGIRIAN